MSTHVNLFTNGLKHISKHHTVKQTCKHGAAKEMSKHHALKQRVHMMQFFNVYKLEYFRRGAIALVPVIKKGQSYATRTFTIA